MNVPFVDLKALDPKIRRDISKEISKVISSSSFVLGKFVEEFEERFAEYCGTHFAVGVNSGTSALHLALLAMGVGRDDEVITVPFTYVATVEAILYVGAKPVFVDVSPTTYNIDVESIERVITEKTKAVIPVHLYGRPAEMWRVLELAAEYRLAVVEDACQAHGAEYFLPTGHWAKVGGIGTAGCFSFYPSKNLGAYGEGGAIVTNDRDVYEKVRALRDHGQVTKNKHIYVGYNYRMEGIQGAVLKTKLQHLDAMNDARRTRAAEYSCLLNSHFWTPEVVGNVKSVYHLYVVRVYDGSYRDRLRALLESAGVGTGIHYSSPVHLLPAYDFLGYHPGDFPNAELCAQTVLSLPMYPELTSEQVKHVVDLMEKFSPSVIR